MPKKTVVAAASEPAEEPGVPIVVRRAMMKDEAVSAPTNDTQSAEAGNPIEVKSKKSRIEPLTSTANVPEPDAVKPADEPLLPPAAPPAAEAAKPTDTKTAAPEPTTPTPAPAKPADKPAETSNTAGEFTLAGEDSVDTPDDPSQNPIDQARAKADKEAAEKQAALDKLVDAQTYFLPLNRVEKRRTKQLLFVTLLLLVVLAGAAAFWANGQGIISIPGL